MKNDNGIAASNQRRVMLTKGMGQQRALFRLTDRLYRATSLDEAYTASLEAIMDALGCDRASILRFDRAGVMRFVAWRGLSDGYRQAVDGHSPWEPGEIDPEPIYLSDINQSSESDRIKNVVGDEGISSLGFVPLTSNRKVVGKFMVYHREPHDFDQEERDAALLIARQLSFCIERQTADLAASRLAALIESSDDAIISKDLEGIIQSWNRGAERLFGYAAEEVIGGSITILIPPDRLQEETAILSRIRSGQRMEHYETVRRRKDGRLIHVSLSISPIIDATGKILGASKIARDITSQHLAQEQQQLLLREMNHRVKNLFAVTSSIINLNARTSPSAQALAASVTDRLNALGRAHALTMAGRDSFDYRATLGWLIEAVLAPYREQDVGRFNVSGDEVNIASKAITPIALMLHEFATNAAKYGGLAKADGSVEIKIKLLADSLEIHWREKGGPQLAGTASGEKGFGSRLVEATAAQLNGKVEREWSKDGLAIKLTLARDGIEATAA